MLMISAYAKCASEYCVLIDLFIKNCDGFVPDEVFDDMDSETTTVLLFKKLQVQICSGVNDYSSSTA